jgi:uncharacterized protein YjbJ (UPF0337 family)
MDKDKIKGKIKDVGGRVERQAGEWTDDKEMQSEGAAKQAEGKAQNTWGKIKERGRDAADDIRARVERSKQELKRKNKKAA